MILTSELLVLALVDDDLELDRVVLSETTLIDEFNGFSHGDESALFSHQSARMVQIATAPEGFNSGRTYYLRTESEETFSNILKTWPVLALKARRRADARTVLEKVQRELRRFHDSKLFQTVVALVIAAVNLLPARARIVAARSRFVDV